jgi:putative SOS response-associated peptidase YedK
VCGRYAASAGQDQLVETFAIDEVVDLPPPSWNVAPTDRVAAVVERPAAPADGAGSPGDHAPRPETIRRLVAPRWGLVPSWAKSPATGAAMINARVETVASKPAFRRPLSRAGACCPPTGITSGTTPSSPTGEANPSSSRSSIRPADGGLLVMAGLYEFWKHPDTGEWLTSCAVITTTATDALGHIHDRMPMVIRPEAWDAWLDPGLVDADAAVALLSVTDAEGLEAYAVSRAVGNVRNNGPDLVAPIDES